MYVFHTLSGFRMLSDASGKWRCEASISPRRARLAVDMAGVATDGHAPGDATRLTRAFWRCSVSVLAE